SNCFAPGFEDKMQEFMDEIRGMDPSDPSLPVKVAGDLSRSRMKLADDNGAITYHKNMISSLNFKANVNAWAAHLWMGGAADLPTTCGSSSSGPKDDPVAALYGNLTYTWANSIVNWSCVYNIKDYHGSFEDAQKAAVSGGGGVIYYPAGTYSFTSNIMIESNIVIRGEPTTEPAKKDKSPGSLSPKTVFKCTFGEHFGVFNNDPKATN
uniref:Rhamnogalacturonase A/B/Epimerase-like pectate lyase domain-containing protein n=1 Tax=Amphimedon queenslandica TaxID=400682 RepID=A0A1X7SHV5_AMPQE